MAQNEIVFQTHKVVLDASPKDADLAFVSIDKMGTAGQLNQMVLRQYGYHTEVMPGADHLRAGYSSVHNDKNRPIIFVVTVGDGDVKASLEKNLFFAMSQYTSWLYNKTAWIPLMGTGAGGLSLSDSYKITKKVIERYIREVSMKHQLIISIPKSAEGIELFDNLVGNREITGGIVRDVVSDFVTKLNCAFYLAGAFWSGDDQTQRFIEEGIWENGRDDEESAAFVSRIVANDIIILKSVYAKRNGDNYLRVKAIGIVKEPTEDGISIGVDWRIRDINQDIEGMSYYRGALAEAVISDVVEIFSILDPVDLYKLGPAVNPDNSSANVVSNRVASLISDSDNGADYLDITKDVIAFARVIASKGFKPPLAIALFGKWGSGKSFFMNKLRDQIEMLGKADNKLFCQGVAQIHFNAWSYMDANLWASFVSRIFEGLNEYISQNSKSDDAKKEIETQLSTSLNMSKEEIEALKGKKRAVEKKLEVLQQKHEEVKKELNEKVQMIGDQTAWDVITNAEKEFKASEKLISALRQNETFIRTEEELKKIVPSKYWDHPEEAYRKVSSVITFLREYFKRDKIGRNLFCLIGILCLIFLAPVILDLLSVRLSNMNFTIPQAGLSFLVLAGSAWRRGEVIYKKMQPVIASFWKIKEEYEAKRKEALARFEQQEKALLIEMEKDKQELLSIGEQIQKEEGVKADLEFRINNTAATEALYSFIEKRANSEDYRKHLGIISIIRRDFEVLNGLFVDHHREFVAKKEAEKFRSKFTKPLQRIILYIDDLDRCPEENVVQVLEAVNLLMAFPLFVVIVGVDPRWVKNALIKRYVVQFTGKMDGSYESSSGIEMIEPSNYLEKIFQVPFHLKDAAMPGVKNMIRQLATPANVKTEDTGQVYVDETKEMGKVSDGEERLSNADISLAVEKDEPVMEAPEERIELVELSDKEIKLLEDMGEVIGPNPRALKRFVNIYKIVKAHEEFAMNDTSPQQDQLAVMFLLAVASGRFRTLVPSFENYLSDPKNENSQLSSFLQPRTSVGEKLDHLKHQLDKVLSDNTNYRILQQTPVLTFIKHNLFIRRFTFKSI